jgi:hypothetical protein
VNLDSTNRWLTLAANIGVMAGIIFLAFELQQNTVATQLQAASNFQSSHAATEIAIYGNPEFAELLRKGREGEEVSGTDQLRLAVFYGGVIRQWQFHHFQHLSNALSDEIWQANQAFMAKIAREDRGLLNHWRMNTREFIPAFNEMFESMIVEGT